MHGLFKEITYEKERYHILKENIHLFFLLNVFYKADAVAMQHTQLDIQPAPVQWNRCDVIVVYQWFT